jgi:hypothetical protein
VLELRDFFSRIWRGEFRFGGGRDARFSISQTRRLHFIAQTVYAPPFLLGAAAAYVFAFIPQVQEIYVGVAEEADWGRGFAGLAAVCLLSAFLYAWSLAEVSKRIDGIYPDHADIHFDRRVFALRDLKAAIASSLPFVGLFIGLAEVYRRLLDVARAGLPEDALPGLAALPRAFMAAAAIALLGCALTLLLLHKARNRRWIQASLLYFCYCVTLFLVAFPVLAPDTTLAATRLAGPLMGSALVLIEAAVIVRLTLWVLGKAFKLILGLPSALLMMLDGVPVALRAAVFVLLPLLALTGVAASIIGRAPEGEEAGLDAPADDGQDDISKKFQLWLAERKTGPRYPVFIVAAQGGGIYAASTAGAFLAAMQDHCPAFARHIFAISAVSGGSVGASLFDAAFADSIARGVNRKAAIDVEPGCDSIFAAQGELAKRMRAVTQQDHLSPVLAYLAPDLASPILPAIYRKAECTSSPSASLGRDRILEKSFLLGFRESDPLHRRLDTSLCARLGGTNLMVRPFSSVWSAKGDVPALLLNATSVETGYRVAFSPFNLRPIGNGTLYSFGNLKDSPADPTLIEAAVVSARFPVIMPPWTFNLDGRSRLTFVDGGYADSSGAATALQLYNQLKRVGGEDVDLYLITLTDKFKALTPRDGRLAKDVQPVGLTPVKSLIYDVLSPVTALLSVRDMQSRKAVKEAHTELEENMIVVQLDQKVFPLPLGWKLSALSGDVIRYTIGDPGRCGSSAEENDDALPQIANRNSCELKRIVDLLAPKTLASHGPAPQTAAPKIFGSWSSAPQ